jgi:aryl-alcohol dehydrogenase-like predicted oxidoreductase
LVAHQNQYSLLDRRPENGLLGLCREAGAQLLSYGSLAGGFLAQRWLGRAEPRGALANRSLVKYRLIVDEFGGWDLFQELLRELSAIARKHEVSLANIAVRWVLDRSRVAAVLLGARSADHLADNQRLFEFELDDEDHQRLAAVLRRSTGPAGEPFELERLPSGRHGAIMKTELNRQGDHESSRRG